MKKKKHRLLIAAALALSMLVSTGTVSAIEPVEWNSPEGGLDTYYYIGESIPYSCTVHDIWVHYYTCPSVLIVRSRDNYLIDGYYFNTLPEGYYNIFNDKFYLDPKTVTPGVYYFSVMAIPTEYENGTDLADGVSAKNIKIDCSDDFYVRKLHAPSRLRVATGKRKNTISYRKAQGAMYYQIYRSTRRSGGYRQVASTSRTSFRDRSVKRGNRYYYKVRSVRSKYGTIHSSFSSPKKSGRVK